MTRTRFGLIVLALATLLAASCGLNRSAYQRGMPPPPEGNPVDLYRIVPGDVLSIDGGKHQELNSQSVRVDERGDINLLYVGKIRVVGKTKAELEAAINAAYRESGNYEDTQVSV